MTAVPIPLQPVNIWEIPKALTSDVSNLSSTASFAKKIFDFSNEMTGKKHESLGLLKSTFSNASDYLEVTLLPSNLFYWFKRHEEGPKAGQRTSLDDSGYKQTSTALLLSINILGLCKLLSQWGATSISYVGKVIQLGCSIGSDTVMKIIMLASSILSGLDALKTINSSLVKFEEQKISTHWEDFSKGGYLFRTTGSTTANAKVGREKNIKKLRDGVIGLVKSVVKITLMILERFFFTKTSVILFGLTIASGLFSNWSTLVKYGDTINPHVAEEIWRRARHLPAA